MLPEKLILKSKKHELKTLIRVGTKPETICNYYNISMEYLSELLEDEESGEINETLVKDDDLVDLISLASNYQNKLLAGDYCGPPDEIRMHVSIRPEIDLIRFGLERHLIINNFISQVEKLLGSILRVGIQKLWLNSTTVFGDFIFPAENPDTSQLRSLLSLNRINFYLDFTVTSTYQVFNPHALIMLDGIMDWDYWALRVNKAIKRNVLNLLKPWLERHEFPAAKKDRDFCKDADSFEC
ncbi:MAG: hypothetical protein ACXQS8_04635, partial [Candidatus Helarchaeales archaeon]